LALSGVLGYLWRFGVRKDGSVALFLQVLLRLHPLLGSIYGCIHRSFVHWP
jgi:hypothetical protein